MNILKFSKSIGVNILMFWLLLCGSNFQVEIFKLTSDRLFLLVANDLFPMPSNSASLNRSEQKCKMLVGRLSVEASQ